MTGTWSQGYIADLEYNTGFYGDLAPGHLDLVCLLNSVQPPSREGGLRYCELGSGQGLTTNILAAANPGGTFHGVDFNPAHIARAREKAGAAGLDNVHFHEASFDELSSEPSAFPDFDYITLHGVYSWVSGDLRQAILRFIAQRLKPGGVVCVSYNALPGWTPALPVQYLLEGFAREAHGRSDVRINAAIDRLSRVAEAGSPYLQDNPFVSRVAEMQNNKQFTYLAHEYLTPNWQPFYHSTVAHDMGRAKLDFAGSGSLLYNFPALCLSEGQRASRDEVADPALRETLADYFTGRSFREDVFVRGRRALSPTDRDSRLARLSLALVSPRREIDKLALDAPVGTVEPRSQVYTPMLDALAERPRSIGELLALPEVRAHGEPSPAEVAGLLVASGHVLPVDGADRTAGRAAALNAVLADDAIGADNNWPGALAAPRLGTGIKTSALELEVLALTARFGADDPRALAEAIWAPIKARGETLVQDGQPVQNEAENLDLLTQRARLVLENKMPAWRMLGVLAQGA